MRTQLMTDCRYFVLKPANSLLEDCRHIAIWISLNRKFDAEFLIEIDRFRAPYSAYCFSLAKNFDKALLAGEGGNERGWQQNEPLCWSYIVRLRIELYKHEDVDVFLFTRIVVWKRFVSERKIIIYSANEQRGLAMFSKEKRQKRKNLILGQFREMINTRKWHRRRIKDSIYKTLT
ncbi:PREDICTED: uncharacterized protein LOC105145359 [Acromyrmex echinatior]|uniref:uncharacterized protein LOC105145359 n=1 Tax=Acromyrmex echinatior TaxID=103372 RepID=UPI000580CEF5|nr:PREDICTED: uncharacterized protein LOC105145359 [Acromyrmex echinatior]